MVVVDDEGDEADQLPSASPSVGPSIEPALSARTGAEEPKLDLYSTVELARP